jgi:hypothetical protein
VKTQKTTGKSGKKKKIQLAHDQNGVAKDLILMPFPPSVR